MKISNENTGGATGWCLDVPDLAVSKLFAGREKDLDFVRVLLHHQMVQAASLAARIEALPTPGPTRDLVRARLRRLVGPGTRAGQ